MARNKKAINYQNIEALDIIAMQDSYFNKFLTELKLGFADRALIFGAILHVKAETETNPQSDLILACYTRYDDYVQDSSNKWIDKDYLPKEA